MVNEVSETHGSQKVKFQQRQDSRLFFPICLCFDWQTVYLCWWEVVVPNGIINCQDAGKLTWHYCVKKKDL